MNRNLHGFRILRERKQPELSGTLVEMEHEKTGAQLVWLDNKCDNKLFCVGFKTIPEDSTGVFHILEHSVLCGSEKYPVKEPFVELLKSSMNTFLNAMTFSDKTIYPVSSRNTRDFLNLTAVYLDAVFAPAIVNNPNIFYQEGWHLETGDEPGFRGVVFNEMKGAMSGVDDQIEEGIMELLFPDNCYRFNSGGDPEVIPELTYEQFLDSYHKYYHPSNSRIYLDGDIPVEQTLELIDSYLSRFEKAQVAGEIPMQAPVCPEKTAYFETPDGQLENKAIFTMGKLLCTWEDRLTQLAMQVLCSTLADTNDAPLCKAILDAGLGEDFIMGITDGIQQPYLTMQVRNTDDCRSSEIREVIRNTVRELVEGGIDKEALEASINRFAFRMRQTPEPQGIYRAINCYNSWLYGGDAAMYLVNDEVIAALREMLAGDGFEKLLERMVLSEDWAVLHMLPSATAGEEKRQAEEKRVQQMLERLTPEARKALEEANADLVRWQQSMDTPEQLATLPQLPISEIGDAPEMVDTAVDTVLGVKVLRHNIPTQGVTHLRMYFTLTDCTLEELTALSLLPLLFGNLPTRQYTARQLQQKIKTYIGRLDYGFGSFCADEETHSCKPYLRLNASVLQENVPMALELIAEILQTTRFDAPESIRQIVLQADEEGKQSGITAGHAMAALAVQSHYSAQAAVSEAMGGYTGVQWLHDFADNFDERFPTFRSLLERLQDQSLCRARMNVSVTANYPVELTEFLEQFPQGTGVAEQACYTTKLPEKLGIVIPAQIAFAAKGYHLDRCGGKYDGSLRVAANILSLDYLWNEVRVQGGAYGCGMHGGRNGMLFQYSYRDPEPARSLNTYDRAGAYLMGLAGDLDKYIISTASAAQPLLSPVQQGALADDRYFCGITQEKLSQQFKEILTTDLPALQAWAYSLDAMAREGAVCVVGYKEALEQCNGLTICPL